jgi:predicted Holliday junction resolvase-like endonuclease
MNTLDDLLRARRLQVRCPCCAAEFPVRKAGLFDGTGDLPERAAIHLSERRLFIAEERQRIRSARSEMQRRSFTSAATSGIGQALEMVAASLPGLPTAAQDCRVLLKPLDYIAFAGASTGEVEAIHFIEVKTGRSRLNRIQSAIRKAIESGAVKVRIANHRLRLK